jgi:hypothetical protein
MARKRAFVRYSKNGKIVPGSLILTSGSFPQGSSTWNEVPADLCCDNPLSFTYDGSNVAITNVTLELYCNGTLVSTSFTNQTSTDAASLESILNNAFDLIGNFTVVGTLVTLTLSQTQKNEFCPSGIFRFAIGSD